MLGHIRLGSSTLIGVVYTSVLVSLSIIWQTIFESVEDPLELLFYSILSYGWLTDHGGRGSYMGAHLRINHRGLVMIISCVVGVYLS